MSVMGDGDDRYVYFLDESAFRETDRPGFRRRVITGDDLQLCFWRIAGGASGSFLHNHPDNEQLGIIFRGKLDFRIGGHEVEKRTVLGPGEAYLAPRGVWHGDSVFHGDDEYGECWILDVFAPPREDLREAALDPARVDRGIARDTARPAHGPPRRSPEPPAPIGGSLAGGHAPSTSARRSPEPPGGGE